MSMFVFFCFFLAFLFHNKVTAQQHEDCWYFKIWFRISGAQCTPKKGCLKSQLQEPQRGNWWNKNFAHLKSKADINTTLKNLCWFSGGVIAAKIIIDKHPPTTLNSFTKSQEYADYALVFQVDRRALSGQLWRLLIARIVTLSYVTYCV